MATVRIPIIGWSAVGDATGQAYPSDYRSVATGDWHARQVVRFGIQDTFNPSVNIYLYGSFGVPLNYVGGAVFSIVWTATDIVGNVYWVLHMTPTSGNDAEVFNTNFVDVQVTDAAPSAAHNRLEAAFTYASGSGASFAPGDEVLYELIRVGADASDTMTASAVVFGLYFQYEDA